jgi:hypothetical protein
MAKHSKRQQKIIRDYYRNIDAIALQRLQELVTELYLSEGKQRSQHWKNVRSHLEKLGVAPSQIDHLEGKDNPELLANLIRRLLGKS